MKIPTSGTDKARIALELAARASRGTEIRTRGRGPSKVGKLSICPAILIEDIVDDRRPIGIDDNPTLTILIDRIVIHFRIRATGANPQTCAAILIEDVVIGDIVGAIPDIQALPTGNDLSIMMKGT